MFLNAGKNHPYMGRNSTQLQTKIDRTAKVADYFFSKTGISAGQIKQPIFVFPTFAYLKNQINPLVFSYPIKFPSKTEDLFLYSVNAFAQFPCRKSQYVHIIYLLIRDV